MAADTRAAEYLIISASLRSAQPEPRHGGGVARGLRQARRDRTQLVDLREFVLPLCDGEAAYGHPHVDDALRA